MPNLVAVDRNVGFFNSYILQRIERNKNFIASFVGTTGSGKSYSALREGEVLDKDFDIRNVCFTPQQFMNLVSGKTKKIRRGSVLVYDEMQVTMSALEYQSLQARLINFVLQTFRKDGFILFVSSPFFDFINKSARKLFHSRIETVSIDYKEKVCYLKPFLLQVNQRSGDIYQKYLRVATKEGVLPVTSLRCRLPSKELLSDYELKKSEFTRELNEGIIRDLKRLQRQKEGKKDLTVQQDNVMKRLVEKKNIKQISSELGIGEQAVYEHMVLIKKKGYSILPIKEGTKIKCYNVEGYSES